MNARQAKYKIVCQFLRITGPYATNQLTDVVNRVRAAGSRVSWGSA